jgi:peptidyl-prolyl cis-trans isomerase C
MIRKLGIPLAIASLVLMTGCNKDSENKGSGAVAATVNGIAIPKERLDGFMKQRGMQGKPDNEEGRKELVDNLASQILVSEEAAKKGLDKSPKVLDQLEMARRSILANAFVEDYLEGTKLTDAELAAEYEKFKGQMGSTEYKARHILVDKEDAAKDIIAKLKANPKAFAALAKANSKDPGSKNNGGDLGWFDPRSMVPEFGNAVAGLKKGEMTQAPVKSQFGYHVIMLEDSRPKEFAPLEQVKPMLTQEVQQQKLRKLIDDMKAKAKIEYKDLGAPAPAAPATPDAPAAPNGAPAPAAPAPAPAAK